MWHKNRWNILMKHVNLEARLKILRNARDPWASVEAIQRVGYVNLLKKIIKMFKSFRNISKRIETVDSTIHYLFIPLNLVRTPMQPSTWRSSCGFWSWSIVRSKTGKIRVRSDSIDRHNQSLQMLVAMMIKSGQRDDAGS